MCVSLKSQRSFFMGEKEKETAEESKAQGGSLILRGKPDCIAPPAPQ